MNIRISLVAAFALVSAATIGMPGVGFARGIQADATAGRPLQISGFLSGHTPVYYKNRNRYRALAYHSDKRIFNRFTAIRFENSGAQAIEKITFQLAAYDDVYRPILGESGKPVVKNLVATGPFAPRTTHTLVNANTVWAIPADSGLGCIRMSGIRVVYADGSMVSIPKAEVKDHFPVWLSNKCGVPAGTQTQHPYAFEAGPSPYIAGVYPARWMILGNYHLLYRQPFIAPGDTQPLCAVGPMLEEYCRTGAESAGSMK